MSREWTAKWIGPETGDQSHPVIFKDFYIDDEIKKATLYITSLGIFEAYVNGQRVGGEYLTPYQTSDGEDVQYFSFDVTELLNSGPESEVNSIDVFLGRGWNDDEERFAVKAEFEIEVYKNRAAELPEEPEEQFAVEEAVAAEEAIDAEEAVAAEEAIDAEEPQVEEEVIAEETPVEEAIDEAADEMSFDEEDFDEIFNDDFLEDVIKEEQDMDTIFEDLEEDRVELLAMKGDERIGVANAPFELDDLNDLDDFLERVIDKEPETKEEVQPQRRRNVSFFTMEKVNTEETAAEVSAENEDDDLEIFDFEDWDEEEGSAEEKTAAVKEELAEEEPEEVAEEPAEEEPEEAAEEPAEEEPNEVVKEAEEEVPEEVEEEITEEKLESPKVDLTVAPYSITDEELEAMFDAPVDTEDVAAAIDEAEDDLFSEETLDSLLDETLFPEEAEEEFSEETEAEAEEELLEEAEPEAETELPEEAEPETEEVLPEEAEAETEEELPVEAEPAAFEAGLAAAVGDIIEEEAAVPEEELPEETETIIIGTDETWGYYASDIEYSSIHIGEVFNRLLWEDEENPEKAVEVLDLDIPMTERYALPVIVKERLDVKDVIPSEDGAAILDFGKSFSGFVTFNSSLPKGTIVRMTFAEDLSEDAFADDNDLSGFTYISDGMPEVVGPHFTYFTGRYVKVSGWEGEIDPKNFIGCVLYSDLKRTGFVATSNERLDAIYEDLLAGQMRTSVVMPEEGEPADVFAYAPAASYNMDVKEFLVQYLKGLRTESVDDKLAYAPQIIWNLYQMYGDEAILSENYELMKAWVDHIDAKDSERSDKHFLYDFDTDTDAWVSMDQETETEFIASACYYEATRLTAEAAAVLGKEQDAFRYHRLERRIKQAFLEEYYTGAGRLSVDTQTAYVLALQFGLYVDQKRVADGLEKRLAKDGSTLKCAPAAAPFVCKVLADNGMTAKAYDILLDENQKSFNNEVEFIYAYMAGIKPLEPGFSMISLAPVPDGRVDFCMSSFDSPVGTIVSNWTINEEGALNFHFEVPEGATAKIALPYYPVCAAGGNEVVVKNGSYDYTYMPSIKLK